MQSKYETHVLPYLEKIAGWAKEGATAKEIAGKLRIASVSYTHLLLSGDAIGQSPMRLRRSAISVGSGIGINQLGR